MLLRRFYGLVWIVSASSPDTYGGLREYSRQSLLGQVFYPYVREYQSVLVLKI